MSGDDHAERFAARWLILALLIGLILLSLGFVGWKLATRPGEGYGAFDVSARSAALRADVADPVSQRQQLRELAEKFVVEFHTYGPDDLSGGELTGYRDRAGSMMTAKFKAAFEKQLALPQATVSQIGARSIAEATSSGVATVDADSAEVLVGGWTQTSYRNPSDKKKRVESDQQPIRFRVILVLVDGKWLVDDLDQVGDNLPGFAEQGAEGGPSGAPSTPASPGATQ